MISKPAEKYGETDYKMIGKNGKPKWILIFGLEPDDFNLSQVVPLQNKYGTIYKMLMKLQLKFINSEFPDFVLNMKPSRWNLENHFKIWSPDSPLW